ncbi:MAG: hypothetical protein ACRDK7_03140 [Solirubrobacteraceae bacterium]
MVVANLSFTIPLETAPQVHFITVGGKGGGPGTGCPTTSEVTKPEAEPGNLCIFAAEMVNANYVAGGLPQINSPEVVIGAGGGTSGKTGALMLVAPEFILNSQGEPEGFKSGPVGALGTWAVTAE